LRLGFKQEERVPRARSSSGSERTDLMFDSKETMTASQRTEVHKQETRNRAPNKREQQGAHFFYFLLLFFIENHQHSVELKRF
jgi:hypothetical protein